MTAEKKVTPFTNIELKSTEHLGLLLGHQALPQKHYTLQADTAYCFVYNKFLYGIYKLTHTSKNSAVLPSTSPSDERYATLEGRSRTPSESIYYILKKTHNYRRLRLHHTTHRPRLEAKLADKRLLRNLFRDENKTEQKLFLKIIDHHDHYMVSYAGESVPEGMRHYLLRDNYKALKRLTEKLSPELKKIHSGKSAFNDFQTWGRKLGDLLIKPELATQLCLADTAYVNYPNNALSLPLSILIVTHPNQTYHKPFNAMSAYLHPSHTAESRSIPQQLHSLGVFTSKEDITMMKEIQAITDKHRLEKTAPKQYSFGTLDTDEILAGLERYDLVHLIFHGEMLEEEFTLVRNNRAFLTLSQMKLVPHLPKVMFLSTCSSEDIQVLKWFFSNAGQSLITMCGDIASQTLPQIVKTFYWQLFTRKSNVRKSFQTTLQALYQKSDVTFFKLKLHGKGDEYFNEKENL